MTKANIYVLGGIFLSLLLSTVMAYELMALWCTDMAAVLSNSEATSPTLQVVEIALVMTQAFGALLLSRMFIVNRSWRSMLAWSPALVSVFAALTCVLIALSHRIAMVG